MATLNFDPSTAPPADAFEPLPAGDYVAHVVASDLRDTKSGDGKYIYLELEISSGSYAGRKLFDRINIVNSNPQAVQIAERTLASICKALDIAILTDTSDLHNKPMTVRVKVEDRQDTGDQTNRIVRYKTYQGQSLSQSPAANYDPSIPF